ncbi:hypothetical protein PCASD_02574 [Puccinia coronata f. sp. avenae]|uniref:Uncharacterized protein n=1 Tax=Puccinia coronata f. sp. avenae TaxID=200324 RepID=A0A2N5TE77_9BASI|nr:hypothetical protein PCASD_08744 [Puccinia coronata f. sp. avenae]PLW47366.1 hypothetical protein PCASD_02574 [Puccinia coronata f. sp. avenae]
MASKNTESAHQDPSGNTKNVGYATDQSQNHPHRRRSSRASSLVVVPNMVAPSSDSRVRVTRPDTQKRPAVAVSSLDSDLSLQIPSESDDESVQNGSAADLQKTKPKKKKQRRQKTVAKKKSTPASKKKGKSKETASVANAQDNLDFDQDTDDGSIVIQPRGEKKKTPEFAKIEEYFYPPTWKEGDPEGVLLNYKCRWCKVVYRGHRNTHGNLVCHRDGFTQLGKNDRGCVNCEIAKKAGVKLPPSVAERRKMETNTSGEVKQPGISGFLTVQPLFDNRVLNQLIMMWKI